MQILQKKYVHFVETLNGNFLACFKNSKSGGLTFSKKVCLQAKPDLKNI